LLDDRFDIARLQGEVPFQCIRGSGGDFRVRPFTGFGIFTSMSLRSRARRLPAW